MTAPAQRRRLTSFLLLWLGYAPVMSLVWFLGRWVLDGARPNWVDSVVLGTTFALCNAAVEALVLRSPAGEAADRGARRALARGALLDDVDVPGMRTALLHVEHLLTQARRWGVPVLAVVAVGIAVLTVVDDLGGGGWAASGLCVAALAGVVWLTSWQLRRVDRLLAELDTRDATGVDRPVA